MLLAVACADERPEATTLDPSGVSAPADDGTGIEDGIGEVDSDDDDGIDDGGTGIFDVGDGEADGEVGGEGGECPCQNVLDGIYVLNSLAPPSVWFYDPPAMAESGAAATASPRRLFRPPSRIRTGTTFPIQDVGPGKFTTVLPAVRPASSSLRRLDTPSTRTSKTRPTAAANHSP